MAKKNDNFLSNKSADSFLRKGKRDINLDELAIEISNGNKVALSQAITLVESKKPGMQKLGFEIIDKISTPKDHISKCIGITGSPGVGKSTFIEQIGLFLIEQGLKVAVLAIDPSSQLSKGSILGDKTRMESLSTKDQAFIRPSASGSALGGVAHATKAVITLCEKAKYDIILVETVGVGQSEIMVHDMTDMMILLLQPGSGDELQGIKKGVVEMADLLVVNKSDTDKINIANQTKLYFKNAVHLLKPLHNDWIVKVLTCSSLEAKGFEEVWASIKDFYHIKTTSGELQQNRVEQSILWFKDQLELSILNTVLKSAKIGKMVDQKENAIRNKKSSHFESIESIQNSLKKALKE